LGEEEYGDGGADEDGGEDGGEGHDVGVVRCRTRALGVGGILV
jgi:hypothetical protein